MAALPSVSPAPAGLQRQMADHLRCLGWTEDRDFARYMRGSQCFTSPRGAEFCTVLEGSAWELGEHVSADEPAAGRYHTVESGEGLDSLDDAIQGRTGFLLLAAPDDEVEVNCYGMTSEEWKEARQEQDAEEYELLFPGMRCGVRE